MPGNWAALKNIRWSKGFPAAGTGAKILNCRAYYLAKERCADVKGAYRRYQEYLHDNQQQFPPRAFALGTAEWRQGGNDHRSPHDAWLESLIISEPASGERSEQRVAVLRVRLLAAYHDGFIELFYPRVFSYSFGAENSERGTGDWVYDEFRRSPGGHVIHEIEWSGGTRWMIEASDIEYQWLPK